MKIVVHRGAHQIGGSCIEVSTATTRIILDAGSPLTPGPEPDPLLSRVPSLFDGMIPSPDAVLITHAHPDHVGLAHRIQSRVPIWMTEGTSKMLLAGSLFARQPRLDRSRIKVIRPLSVIAIGDLRVTAFPVDHSIFDAHAFLVEAGQKRLLYTGDFRAHGRKPGMLAQLVRQCGPAPLDALIIEGTRLGGRASEAHQSEADLERELTEDFRAGRTVLVMYSPLNLDRFVTMFRAAKRAGRIMVIDPYQAFVLHIVRRQTAVPQPKPGSALRVFTPARFPFSLAGRRLAQKRWMESVRMAAVSADEIRRSSTSYVVLFRRSLQSDLFPDGLPAGVTCIFSYWDGYLAQEPMQALAAELGQKEGTLLHRHASGHAHPDDLRRFVDRLKPKVLIPVHTTVPKEWRKWHLGTRVATDGEAITLE